MSDLASVPTPVYRVPTPASAARQVRIRWWFVGAALGWNALLAVGMFLLHLETTSVSSGSSTGSSAGPSSGPGPGVIRVTATTLFQVNPGPVIVISSVLLLLTLLTAAGLRHRARIGSDKASIIGLGAAAVCGAVTVLGILSVGLFVAPLLLLLLLISMPLDQQPGRGATWDPSAAPRPSG